MKTNRRNFVVDGFEKQRRSILEDVLSVSRDLLRRFQSTGAFLAGGKIVSLFNHAHKASDWDICFKTKKGLASMQKVLSDAADGKYPKWGHRPKRVADTKRSTTYKIGCTHVQLVSSPYFIGPPSRVLSRFDFECCMGAYDFATDRFLLSESFLHPAIKTLRYNPDAAASVLRSFTRALKYSKEGYKLDPASVLLMVARLREETSGLETISDALDAAAGMIRYDDEREPAFIKDIRATKDAANAELTLENMKKALEATQPKPLKPEDEDVDDDDDEDEDE